MKRVILILAATLFIQSQARAADALDALDQLGLQAEGQELFRLFSEDLGAAVAYRSVNPAEPLGITGFDISIEAVGTSFVNSDKWAFANSDGEEIKGVVIPRVHVTKGLPFGIDIGAYYAGVSEYDIQITGAEIKYAFLEGGVTMPAIALRASWSQLSGIDQLEFQTTGADLSISKGFAMFTPYAGAGAVWVTSTPQDEAETVGLEEEKFQMAKYFVGINLSLGLLNIGVEGDKTGEATSYSAKLGIRW